MKIKYNIPMLNDIKNGIKNIKSKVRNNKEKNIKTNIKYYTLLVLMLMVGTISFSANLKKYNDISSENYTKYDINDSIGVNKNDVEVVLYDTAISSISTNVSNIINEQDENANYNKNNNSNYIYPIKGEIIKEFAMDTLVYSKTLDMWKVHCGIDIGAPLDSEIVAVQDGEIISVEEDNFYGSTIKIDHKNGYISIYSNLDKIEGVKVGESVKQGEVVGRIGVSANGEIADESHLHFELLKDNEWINPTEVLE